MKRYCFLLALGIATIFSSCKEEEIYVPQVDVSNAFTGSIVKAIYPSNQSEVPLYYSPSITFNYPIDSVFQLTIDGKERNLRIDYVCIFSKNSDQYPIEIVLFNNDSLVFLHPELFKEWGTTYKLEFYSKLMIEDNGEWHRAIRNDRIFEENHVISFKAKNILPGRNVVFENITNLTNNYIIPNESIVLKLNQNIYEEIHVSPYCRIVLDLTHFSVKSSVGGSNVNGNLVVDGDRITFTPSGMVFNMMYDVNAKLEWKYKVNDSLISSDIEYNFNIKLLTFISDNPNDLKVVYSYPCLNQYHFLKDEYPTGYIRFKELPNGVDPNEIGSNSIKVKITDFETTDFEIVATTFTKDSLFITYDFPDTFIQNEKVYRISFHKEVYGTLDPEIYGYYFRTSKYDSFQNKMNSLGSSNSYLEPYITGVHGLLQSITNNHEAFDYWETRSNVYQNLPYSNGLISIENLIEQSSWFNISSISKLYELVDKYPRAIKWRDLDFYGLKPRYRTGVLHSNNFEHPGYINQEILSQGASSILHTGYISIFNFIVIMANRDYQDLILYYQSNGMEELNLQITWFFYNSLWFRLNYTMPGINHTTSYVDLKYYF